MTLSLWFLKRKHGASVKRAISILLIFFCPTVFSETIKLSDVRRYSDGEIARTSLGDAGDYCRSEYGTRLPTIREIATFAQSRGARGFLPMDQCDTRWGWINHKEYWGYGKSPAIFINARNNFDGGFDEFCFDMTGFQPEEGDEWLGSASKTSGSPNTYQLREYQGVFSISFSGEFFGYSARCVVETLSTP